jgi:hypothetical protein
VRFFDSLEFFFNTPDVIEFYSLFRPDEKLFDVVKQWQFEKFVVYKSSLESIHPIKSIFFPLHAQPTFV